MKVVDKALLFGNHEMCEYMASHARACDQLNEPSAIFVTADGSLYVAEFRGIPHGAFEGDRTVNDRNNK